MKILLTGATGFIGSNIASGLLEQGFDIIATHRTSSEFSKCNQFKDKINWINTDSGGWKETIASIAPDQLIHVAWSGIEVENRNNWEMQLKNFWLSREYFDLAKACGIKKVIACGSQAEYGSYGFPVTEMTVPKPNDAYGATKTLTANYLRTLFENSATEWYWIRIFSVFGEGENPDWLIPSVISKLINGEQIKLTSCEQKYNYLYIKDFVTQLLAIVNCKENKSGIYNLCNSESIILKALLKKVADLMNLSEDLLEFGEISQRTGQNMYISGDNKKFLHSFEPDQSNFVGFDSGLRRTIEYYQKTI
jgi:nucleoside-diphosphate-sugar epimerase